MSKRKKPKYTTKQCPKCGSDKLGLIRTQFIKVCADCGHWFPWPLEEDQDPLR